MSVPENRAVVGRADAINRRDSRRLWRLGYRRGAWWAGIVLGAITVAASVLAGLLGPVAIAICAVMFSLPVWGAWWWLAHNG